MAKKGPCWKGYEMVGMKKKGGKNVPNCVPKKWKVKKATKQSVVAVWLLKSALLKTVKTTSTF